MGVRAVRADAINARDEPPHGAKKACGPRLARARSARAAGQNAKGVQPHMHTYNTHICPTMPDRIYIGIDTHYYKCDESIIRWVTHRTPISLTTVT